MIAGTADKSFKGVWKFSIEIVKRRQTTPAVICRYTSLTNGIFEVTRNFKDINALVTSRHDDDEGSSTAR